MINPLGTYEAPQFHAVSRSALRAGLGDEVRLIVDVNQGWTEAECIRFMPGLGELGVALIEQRAGVHGARRGPHVHPAAGRRSGLHQGRDRPRRHDGLRQRLLAEASEGPILTWRSLYSRRR
ncbi:enolase C-terminal domain-like protein [Bradyrhizobium sp. USDA 4470]